MEPQTFGRRLTLPVAVPFIPRLCALPDTELGLLSPVSATPPAQRPSGARQMVCCGDGSPWPVVRVTTHVAMSNA